MRIVLAFLLNLGIVGCVSGQLQSDYSKSSIDSNYHSALIKTESLNYGVAIESANIDSTFNFSVFGIHRGTVSVSSKLCKFEESKVYSEPGFVDFEVPFISERCIFSIHVNPQFSEEESKGKEWRSLSGVLLLRRSYRRMYLSAIRERTGRRLLLTVPVESKSELVLMGCGVNYSAEVSETVNMELHTDNEWDEGDCVIEGYLKGELETVILVVYLSRYSSKFTKLSKPDVKFGGSSISVFADRSVSNLGFQSSSVLGHQYEFGVDPSLAKILYTYTVKGRTTYCEIKSFGEVTCQN